MSNCFQLARKEQPNEPVRFSLIDDEMCAHFGVEPDKQMYYCGWYDYVGLKLACGHDFERIKVDTAKLEPSYFKDRMLLIVDYLAERFVSNAWYEVRR